MRRVGFISLSPLALVAVLVVGNLLWQALELSSVENVSRRVEHLSQVAALIRLGLIAGVIGLWPQLISWACARGGCTEHRRADLLAQRWRLLGWLLLIELLLGQRLIGRLLSLVTGGAV
jgi:hypothetical protein